MSALAPEVYLSMGLTQFEYDLIVEKLGRHPSLTECGMLAVMWSEHCGYKYSRPILAYFKKYKEAMEGAGLENAGIIPLDGNLGIAMKVESHNHPSAVAPYQGAATGVGGIIRDIFTMGARPIASLNSLRFGPIRDGEADPEVLRRNKEIFEGVVAGIAGYGNCVGVPTVGGEVSFHPRYSGNPLVNAMSVGLVDLDDIATAGAYGVGNPVIYLGSATGKDGIHGATFASTELDEEGEDKRPNVQIGDPFAEKVLIEATLEALKTGAIAAIQDMGAAGLTCSTIEMSAKGDVGMDVNLDLVPAREENMSGYELMLSESQERMLCVAHKGREQEVIDVFKKWGTHAVVIGYVTEGEEVIIRRNGVVEAQLPAKLLADECPTYTQDLIEPESYRQNLAWQPDSLPTQDLNEALLKLAAAPTLASKRWVYRQYDQQVQTQSVVLPGQADAAVLAPRGTEKGIALAIDGNGVWTDQDPYVGGLLAVVESARNVACTGARPAGVTDGLNFGSPQNLHVYWQFERAVKGIADAAEALGTPVISGNVSFYNERSDGGILPSPMIGMAGILDKAEDRLTMAFPQHECLIFLVSCGADFAHQQGLGASSYLLEVLGKQEGTPVQPNLGGEKLLHGFLADCARDHLVLAAHDVSEGGTVFALSEMCIAGKTGCRVQLDADAFQSARLNEAAAFGEVPGFVILAVAKEREEALRGAVPAGLKLELLGQTTPEAKRLMVERNGNSLISVSIDELIRSYEEAIPSVMA